PWIKNGAAYAIGMITVGVLISFANCVSTFFGARFFLPVFSLFQLAMFLGVSLLGSVLTERLESFRNPR
ncbi:MAG TPA: hypothetical protein VE154_06985, partial [Chthoniobacterales bacterium]|nr:hypothetical protein [Chthoniobacterales bacterium]